MDPEPLKIGSSTKWSRHAAAFRKSTVVSADDRLVEIHLGWKGTQKYVRDISLSILLMYSERAKVELKDAAKTTSYGKKLKWIISMSAFHVDLEIGSFNFIFRWLESLPRKGYSENYAGKPQIPEKAFFVNHRGAVVPMETLHYLRIYEAVHELQLAVPISNQYMLRKSAVKMLWEFPLSASELEMIYEIFNGFDERLVQHACKCTIEFLYDDWMTDEETEEFGRLCQTYPELASRMQDIEETKARMAKLHASRDRHRQQKK